MLQGINLNLEFQLLHQGSPYTSLAIETTLTFYFKRKG